MRSQLPVLVKASRGRRRQGHAHRAQRRPSSPRRSSARAARRSRAFGDDTLLLERYIERPRHVEIQILGDTHGNVVHLWERECSIQRRHQKIVEEAPSPALDDAAPRRDGRRRGRARPAVGYVGAGTVEFIARSDGQLLLPRGQHAPPGRAPGHRADDRPRSGRASRSASRAASRSATPPRRRSGAGRSRSACAPRIPSATSCRRPARCSRSTCPPTVRADIGVVAGSEVGIHYDSMLGKLIAHAPTRARGGAACCARALDETWVPGLVTNRELLARILAHPAFLAGELDTHFLERHAGELGATPPGLDRAARRRDRRHARRHRRAPSPHRTSSRRPAGATSGSPTSRSPIKLGDARHRARLSARRRGGFDVRDRRQDHARLALRRRRRSACGSSSTAVIAGRRASHRRRGARLRARRGRSCSRSSSSRGSPITRAQAVAGGARRADAGQGREGPRRRRAGGHRRLAARRARGDEDGAHRPRPRGWHACARCMSPSAIRSTRIACSRSSRPARTTRAYTFREATVTFTAGRMEPR